MESKISVTNCGYTRSLKAARRKEWSTVKTKMEFYFIYERFKGILEVFQSNQNCWVMKKFHRIRRNKKNIYKKPQVIFMEFSVHTGKGTDSGGEEKDKARQSSVFLTPTDPFGNDPEEEEPDDDFTTVPQKAAHATKRKYDQNAIHWTRLSKAKDQGLEFWQMKSFAIMTYATIPGDCIDRVTSQNGERVDCERLETPRPAPKVTWKKNAQS